MSLTIKKCKREEYHQNIKYWSHNQWPNIQHQHIYRLQQSKIICRQNKTKLFMSLFRTLLWPYNDLIKLHALFSSPGTRQSSGWCIFTCSSNSPFEKEDLTSIRWITSLWIEASIMRRQIEEIRATGAKNQSSQHFLF